MGLIQAFTGSVGGALGAQWRDFLTVPSDVAPTAAFFAAVPSGQNAGRGSNTRGPQNIISNGSKIIVPEGYGLVLFENGRLTGLSLEAGGYEWNSSDPNSATIFAGQWGPAFKAAWSQFTFGGQPGASQQAFYVSLKALPNNRFGTQSEIYFDDMYLNSQVGVVTRGSYTLRIVDPVLFVTQVVPATYLVPGAPAFDFTDMENPASDQLFNEVVGSLAQAFSIYSNDPTKGRINKLQGDSIGFAQSLSAAVEENYQWKTQRGLVIEKVALVAIEYDQNTKELLKTVQRADALMGNRGNSNLQASMAQGLQSAGENSGAAGLMGLGMVGGMGGGFAGLQQPTAPAAAPAPAPVDIKAELAKAKDLLDSGLISEDDFTAMKKKILDL